MNKKIIIMGLSLLMLCGCSATNTDTVEETTLSETVSETVAETTTETTTEIIEEVVEEEIEEVIVENYWTEEKIQEQLGDEYDLSNFTCNGSIERGGAELITYSENGGDMLGLVIHCKADKTMELLYAQNGPMGSCPQLFNSADFPEWQGFENCIYVVTDMAMGNGQPITMWYLSDSGEVFDLSNAIAFETESDGLYIGDMDCGNDNWVTIIGVREQIEGGGVGASQILPVSFMYGEVVLFEDEVVDVVVDEVADVHEWEIIDYYGEYDIVESGRIHKEEIPFKDYALNVIGDENIVDYFEENMKYFADLMLEGTSYSANVARIDGDFDNDGEYEYLVATNYGGAGVPNNIAIVDNGEVVYWADTQNVSDFSRVRVGEYFKADPDKLTNGVFDDYIKYTYEDYTTNADNMFIGVKSREREAFNYYYRIIYDETEGYSIKLVKRIGWETVHYEGDNGPVSERRFIEETF